MTAVERLLERVSSARERLERVSTTLKRFRQAVLTAGCSGRLTADWRAKYPNAQSVKVMLRSLGVEPLADNEVEEEIPEGWRWVRFGDLLAELRNGLYDSRSATCC
jgi:type I restriction enzyme S subunit